MSVQMLVRPSALVSTKTRQRLHSETRQDTWRFSKSKHFEEMFTFWTFRWLDCIVNLMGWDLGSLWKRTSSFLERFNWAENPTLNVSGTISFITQIGVPDWMKEVDLSSSPSLPPDCGNNVTWCFLGTGETAQLLRAPSPLLGTQVWFLALMSVSSQLPGPAAPGG